MLLTGCQTTQSLPRVNLAEPGWTVKQGQAVWHPSHSSTEIAGELLVALHADGRSLVEFSKTPFPILIAQVAAARWEIEFVPEQRRLAGRGHPPSRFIWLHLPSMFCAHSEPPARWVIEFTSDHRWQLKNRATGERLEGYLE